MVEKEMRLYKQAFSLSLFTIFYNLVEGLVSIYFGYSDDTLTLFGFGIDSFIEVISGIGIAIMVLRIRKSPNSNKSNSEISALKITGTAFYMLCIGLLVGIFFNLMNHRKPETTFWGIVISIISILVMLWLVLAKRKVGKKLNSQPILADSNCTKICIYMSVILLLSSLIYYVTGFAYADIIGTAGLVYFSFTEGKEALEKAKGKSCGCESCH